MSSPTSEPLCLTVSSSRYKEENKEANGSSHISNRSSSVENTSKNNYNVKNNHNWTARNQNSVKDSKLVSINDDKSHDVISRDDDLNDDCVTEFVFECVPDRGKSEAVECGKCICSPSIAEKANVVVVKESCKNSSCRRLARINCKVDSSALYKEVSQSAKGIRDRVRDMQSIDGHDNCDNNDEITVENEASDSEFNDSIENGVQSDGNKRKVPFDKPLKKLIITERHSKKDSNGPVITTDSKFLTEILNANSPFL